MDDGIQRDDWLARTSRVLSWLALLVGYFLPIIPAQVIYSLLEPSSQWTFTFWPPAALQMRIDILAALFASLAIGLLAVIFYLRRAAWFFLVGTAIALVYCSYQWIQIRIHLAGMDNLWGAILFTFVYPAGIIASLGVMGLCAWKLRMDGSTAAKAGFATFVRRGLWTLLIPYLLILFLANSRP